MGNTKFKVGDKVRVREDLKTWHEYGGFTFTEGMQDTFGGKVATIYRVDHENRYEHYHLTEDGIGYCWTAEMLELIDSNSFTKANLESGMVVECRDGLRLLYVHNTFMRPCSFMSVSDYEDDLSHRVTAPDSANHDICKVYTSTGRTFNACFNDSRLTLIWERKEEIKEMTVAEIEKQLGHKVKVIADKE